MKKLRLGKKSSAKEAEDAGWGGGAGGDFGDLPDDASDDEAEGTFQTLRSLNAQSMYSTTPLLHFPSPRPRRQAPRKVRTCARLDVMPSLGCWLS